MESKDLVVVGRIRRSHGVKGVVVVEPLTADPDQVFVEGRHLIAGTVKGEPALPEKLLRIEMSEPFQGGYRVHFDAISGRDEADRWRNRCLLSPRVDLPEPDEDEIYLHDLVTMTVEGKGGGRIGQVAAYYELRHDIMIEVARAADTVMIPYRFVVEVDRAGRRIVVDPPDGLL